MSTASPRTAAGCVGPRTRTGDAAKLVAALLVFVALGACERAPILVAVGTPAPAFELPSLKGPVATFPAGFLDRVVAIRFWAEWCSCCRTEMVALEPVYRQYRDRGLTLLAVNIMQPREQVEAFARELGLTVDVLLDADGRVSRAYGIVGVPVTVFVDREGVVRGRIVGESTTDAFVRMVDPLLEMGVTDASSATGRPEPAQP